MSRRATNARGNTRSKSNCSTIAIRARILHAWADLYIHAERIDTEQQRWLKFFKDGEQLDADALPPWMDTDAMRQTMNTLKTFSEKERAYHAYRARQNDPREQRGIQRHLDEPRAEAEQTNDSAVSSASMA